MTGIKNLANFTIALWCIPSATWKTLKSNLASYNSFGISNLFLSYRAKWWLLFMRCKKLFKEVDDSWKFDRGSSGNLTSSHIQLRRSYQEELQTLTTSYEFFLESEMGEIISIQCKELVLVSDDNVR